MRNFPTIGEYNQTIQNKGSWAFQSLSDLNFIPSKTFPIKIFSFGSGSYAVVFKANKNGKNYAIRCFLSTEQENINRYQSICSFLKTINEKWKTDIDFLNNEIEVKGNRYPVLIMEWIDGVLINQFVTDNLHNNNILSELQNQLVEISDSLESHQIGHGDLQCGNIIVQKIGSNFQVKLIDYDGMYIPQFGNSQSLENGRSEFQHPKRTKLDFSPTMDRFSFWVMLTALEALKYDKSLWREVMQGGFNTLDNFLFTINDFTNPSHSKLFNKLELFDSESVNFYSKKIKQFCVNKVDEIEKPILFNQETFNSTQTKKLQKTINEVIIINSFPLGCNVLTSNLQFIGKTPLEINKFDFIDKEIIIKANNGDYRKVLISSFDREINVRFINEIAETNSLLITENEPTAYSENINHLNQTENTTPTSIPVHKRKSYWFPILFISIIVIVIIVFYTNFQISEQKYANSESTKNTTMDTTTLENKMNLSEPIPTPITTQPNNILYQKKIKNSSEFHYLSVLSNEEKIRRFLQAEDDENWDIVTYLFSNHIEKYWYLNSPSYQELHSTYQYNWNNTTYRRNEILYINNIDENEYKVALNFYFTKKSDNSQNATYNEVIFKFDYNGDIYFIDENQIEQINSFFPKDYYVNKIKRLYDLHTISYDRQDYYDGENQYHNLAINYDDLYAQNIDRYYNLKGEISIYKIITEQETYSKTYPIRNYQLSNFKIIDNNPDFTKVTFKSIYNLIKNNGKTYSGNTIEFVVFNRDGKVIEQYN